VKAVLGSRVHVEAVGDAVRIECATELRYPLVDPLIAARVVQHDRNLEPRDVGGGKRPPVEADRRVDA